MDNRFFILNKKEFGQRFMDRLSSKWLNLKYLANFVNLLINKDEN